MVEKIESVIIGGGQAGLSLSYYFTHAGSEHIVLEKSPQVAEAWRNRRWDSFALITPNWAFRLPGAEYTDSEPEGFMPKPEIVRRFEQYEQKNHFPVRYSTEVTRVEPIEDHNRYRVVTDNKIYESKNVILATGMYQKVKIPLYAAQIPQDILQIPSDAYRNPQTLPSGAVLVVGSAQSGCQLAEELHEAGRKVYLSTGTAGRMPRRYRGKDGVEWLNKIGFFDRTVANLTSPRDRFFAPPHSTGKGGGHDINLHKFSHDGIILLGHTRGYEDGKLVFASDLRENLAKSDGFAANLVKMVDEYILKSAMNIPLEEVLTLADGYQAPEIHFLDLLAEGISVIIWACGYLLDYSLVQLPLLDSYGYPSADRGVTQYPGLYLLGIPWMNMFKSGLLMGIGESAQYLAEVLCEDKHLQ
jgi:putative flavoprotein involved in K+ transport